MPANGDRTRLYVDANYPSILRAGFRSIHPHFATARPNHSLHRYTGILGIQILYPQGKEKLVIIATGTGAVINFTLNYLLIPQYFQYGAAFSTLIAELSVLVVIILIGKRFLPIRFISKQNLQYIQGTLLITAFLFLINHVRLNDYLKVLIGIPASIIIYSLYLYSQKDIFALQIKNILVSKLKLHI